jgi:hypothetical protein
MVDIGVSGLMFLAVAGVLVVVAWHGLRVLRSDRA